MHSSCIMYQLLLALPLPAPCCSCPPLERMPRQRGRAADAAEPSTCASRLATWAHDSSAKSKQQRDSTTRRLPTAATCSVACLPPTLAPQCLTTLPDCNLTPRCICTHIPWTLCDVTDDGPLCCSHWPTLRAPCLLHLACVRPNEDRLIGFIHTGGDENQQLWCHDAVCPERTHSTGAPLSNLRSKCRLPM